MVSTSTAAILAPSPQQQVSFRILNKLSKAMFGHVYECTMPQFPNVRVAVKHVSMAKVDRLRTRHPGVEFDDPLQEVSIAKRIDASGGHRNVVSPLLQIDLGHSIFLVNELCEGGDMFSLLDGSPRGMGEGEARLLMLQVLEGARFMHTTLHLAHRDLSLENVLMHQGVCKITDFGLCVDARSLATGRVGKHMYMAPEVLAPAKLDGRYDPVKADVWSMGIMWLIVLTGGSVNQRILRKYAIREILTAWGIDDSSVSDRTVKLLSGMLCIDPGVRFGVDQIIQELAS